ncbi:MAG: sensor histidine kinase [Bacteroidales bacterium]|nr:sensor histidine kinase [Bacteroidales bacterium]
MAARKIIQLIEITRGETSAQLQMIDAWMGTLISVMIIGGVILIREIFFSLKKAETDRIKSERRVLHAIINTEENERKRFAKDLHDDLGPLLATVKMSISALSNRITDPVDKEIISNANHIVIEAINTIKDISNTLSPHVLSNFGLVSATNSFISKVNKTKTLNINFVSNIGKERLNNDVEVVLYRAICELIHNSVKHSGATIVEIDLNIHGKFIILQFNDNGRGFDAEEVKNSENRGMGISNIETRVKSVNGMFFKDTAPGRGLQVLIRINIAEEEIYKSDDE